MYGDSELVCLGQLGSRCFTGKHPARLFAHGTADFAAVFFDEFAGFVAVHVRERSRDDGGLPLEQRLDDSLEFCGESECNQFFDFLRVERRVEKFIDGLADAFADVGHVLQFFDGRGADLFERAEMLRDVSGAGAAYKADAESVQQVFETFLLGGLDSVEYVFRAFLRHAFLRFQVFECEAVQVGNALDFACRKEACNKGGAEILDVHRFAAHEMFEETLYLRLAVHVFAAEDDFAIDVRERFAADGAFFGSDDGGGSGGAEFSFDIRNFGDDFSAFFYADGIAVMQIESCDFIKVVEGGAFDGCACETHGGEVCDWRYGTCAADLEFHGK